jgi:hypothetical protein
MGQGHVPNHLLPMVEIFFRLSAPQGAFFLFARGFM